ncbi:BQ2448_1702 [Microbotryum intermedium]|uniref:RBR-type E3 ubiquitin transferase n=1 Tax=Microbotryum intermedium TaxID=269621 RepID=A0A238FGN5_9BASI|nr:BQ2448_1702 [Microbotryum intermedium]
MNDLQREELLALESILPDCMTWTLQADKVHVTIKVQVDLGQDRQVHVWDLPQPHPHPEVVPEETMTSSTSSPRAATTLMPAASSSVPNPVAQNESQKTRRRDHGMGEMAPTLVRTSPCDAPLGRTSAPLLRPPTSANRLDPIVMSLVGKYSGSATPTTPMIKRRAQAELRTVPVSEPSPEARPDVAAERGVIEPHLLELRYLPPIEMVVIFSDAYPLERGPDTIKIIDRAQWLPEDRLKTLSQSSSKTASACIPYRLYTPSIRIPYSTSSIILSVWSGDESLWAMLDLMQNDSLIETLSLEFPLALKQRSCPSSPGIEPLSSILLSHDLAQRTSIFSLTTYTCSLCLNSFKGTRCVRLASCSDVFCLHCLKDFFTLMITEGMVRSVHCPGVECTTSRVKWEREHRDEDEGRPGKIGKEELRAVVSDGLFERYEWLLKKQTLESDPSVSYCPRCQSAVLKTDDDEKLRICKSALNATPGSSCEYPYCVFCHRVWHGARNPCTLPQSSAIVTQFLSGSPSTQAALEQRYSKASIRRLIVFFEEERLNREWMDKMTMKCPGCDAGVEKSQGCNHMQCSRCSSHFCFRCGKSLSAIDPYKHFSTQGSSCYQKLFDFVAGQANGPPIDQAERDEDMAVALQQEIWHEQGWNPFE